MQSKSTKRGIYGEKERFFIALNFIRKFENFKGDVTIEENLALERCFEIIGGLLKDWIQKGLLNVEGDLVVIDAIKARDKISHFYTGFDINVVNAAIKDFDHLIEITKHIKD